jgi:hypothetical protein
MSISFADVLAYISEGKQFRRFSTVLDKYVYIKMENGRLLNEVNEPFDLTETDFRGRWEAYFGYATPEEIMKGLLNNKKLVEFNYLHEEVAVYVPESYFLLTVDEILTKNFKVEE